VFVPTRGDPSVAWADFDGDKLRCSTGTEGFALCDDAHRLSSLYNDPDLAAIENEPFGVFADGPGGFAVVSHLTGGAVTLIKAPADSSRVQIVDVNRNLFAPDAATLISSATGIVGRPRGPGQAPTDPSLIYVGSRSDRRVQTMTVGQLPVPDQPTATEPAYLLQGSYFFLAQVGSNFGNSTDTRGMQFSPSGDRLYLVNRQPATLQLFDTSLDEGGFPRNRGVGAMDICRQGSTVAVFDPEDSDPTTSAGERAYVTCFQDGELYVVDPRDLSQPEDILLVGRGPYSVVAARTRKLLFVSNTLEDTIAVVDVDPAHLLTHNRVVLRIGTPRIQ
jgi:DNA-binding beta-propeller fold protein YncE